ncbi:hypothetical protein PVAND_000074 [Polypedilum vanderplanki]|uniref:Peptidase S1 domain-containing protein n=1 Tax=Polypedilum vanderplanki TaxID=319348 RepID=A0A9J6BIY5_POLVA|nr:hypothetical protein PVAND_000074 [Polypedilum vanderplanki]
MNFLIKLFALFAIILKVGAIYDGDTAKEHQFPYTVLVHSPQFFCAGAIISDRHIITAAHCLMSIRKGGKAVVNVGVHEYYGGGLSDGITLSSSKFWIHENFTMPSAVFDIGIIELKVPLNFSEKISSLKLSTKENADLDVEDKDVVLSGWGYTYDYSGASRELQYTNLTLYPLNECKKFKSHYIENLNENHICARKTKGLPCSGDSGAVMVSRKTKKIVGILSYVKDAENGVDIHYNDCISDVPVVATRVSSYINWIKEKTGLNFGHQHQSSHFIKTYGIS